MKAENREDFNAAWLEHLSHLRLLANSLPADAAVSFLEQVKKLERFVEVADEHTYGNKARAEDLFEYHVLPLFKPIVNREDVKQLLDLLVKVEDAKQNLTNAYEEISEWQVSLGGRVNRSETALAEVGKLGEKTKLTKCPACHSLEVYFDAEGALVCRACGYLSTTDAERHTEGKKKGDD